MSGPLTHPLPFIYLQIDQPLMYKHHHEKHAGNRNRGVRKWDSKELPNWLVDKLREAEKMSASAGEVGTRKLDTAQDVLGDSEQLRREEVRLNMAKPDFLNKVAAIERQNSLLKPRGRGQGLPQEMSNEAVGRSELGKVKRSGSLLLGPGVGRSDKDFIKKLSGSKKDDEQVAPVKGAGSRNKNKKQISKIGEQVKRLDGGVAMDRNKVKNSALDKGRREGRLPAISVLGSFDVQSYLGAQRMVEGEGDKMKKFQFNQVASDATPPDRYLKDYRNPL